MAYKVVVSNVNQLKKKQYKEDNRQINANKIYNENDVKQCSKCKQQKSYTEFNKCLSTKSGLVSYCKDCYNHDLRSKFSQAISRAIHNSNTKYLSIMSCDLHYLRQWLEFQFDEKMNWRNYGSYFHIDHVKPFSLFNIEDDNERRLMNHWSNLSPLEKHEYIKKK